MVLQVIVCVWARGLVDAVLLAQEWVAFHHFVNIDRTFVCKRGGF